MIHKCLNPLVCVFKNRTKILRILHFSKYNQQYIEDKYLKSLKDKSHLYQDIIHMKKKNINEEFIGKKIDFLLKFKIKVPYLNRVLQGERNTVLDWYMIVE